MKRYVAPALLGLIVITLLIRLPLAIAERSQDYAWFDPIVESRRILLDEYVDEPDAESMQRSAIQGMIETLDDPYTMYIPPARTDDFNKELRGIYAGIGAEVNLRDGYLYIVTPMDDSPALFAGIRAGDLVLDVEGQSTKDVTLEECVTWLTGEAGTNVDVLVRHEDETEETLTITRGHIVTRTVKGVQRFGQKWSYCVGESSRLAYVRLTQFNAATVTELRAALSACQDRGGYDGVILDLRDNPGGGLPTAVNTSDLFLDSGTIVSVRSRNDEHEEMYRAKPGTTLTDVPMVVLINGESASASEIVSGALQENGRARVLGTRSYGKGSVQEVRPLEYGSGTLKFTIALYYLPSGRSLHRRPDSPTWGVDPDPGFRVTVTQNEYIAMRTARRDFEIIRHDVGDELPACATPSWIRDSLQDEQLAVAVERLEERLAAGDWPETDGEDPELAALQDELHRISIVRRNFIERLIVIDERIDEISGLSEGVGAESLLPEDAVTDGGLLELRNASGEVIATFRVEGGDVERALNTLQLDPVTPE